MSDLNASSQTATEKIKVVLTGRPPVRIDPAAWPVLAGANDKDFDNQYEFQANRTSTWSIRLRKHERGCALVYATYRHSTAFQGERGYEFHAGERLSPGADLAAAIERVAERIAEDMESDCPKDARRFRSLANECIADLPAEDCDCDGSDLAVIV